MKKLNVLIVLVIVGVLVCTVFGCSAETGPSGGSGNPGYDDSVTPNPKPTPTPTPTPDPTPDPEENRPSIPDPDFGDSGLNKPGTPGDDKVDWGDELGPDINIDFIGKDPAHKGDGTDPDLIPNPNNPNPGQPKPEVKPDPDTPGGNKPSKDEYVNDIVSNESSVYDIIYENVSYSLQLAGFTTATAMAIDFDDDQGISAGGIMYYLDSINLYSDNSTYAAGFYQIAYKNDKSAPLEKANNLYIKNLSEADGRDYIGTYDYQNIGYDHFVYEDKYIIYYQEADNTIRYEVLENKKENYDLSLGSLYDYDTNQYIYDTSIFDDYKCHSAVELMGKEDYNKLQGELAKISAEQEALGNKVEEYNVVYISPEKIQEYLASDEEDTFFGYNVSDLTAEFGLGTTLKYTDHGFEKQVDESPDFNWKAFLAKVGVGCGVILIGAVVSQVKSGVPFSCALVTITTMALSYALVSTLTTVVTSVIQGVMEGKTPEDILTSSLYAGLDAFANGFLVGSVMASVGVNTGTVKPKACFTEGTAVALGANTYKNIENINVGDYVLAYDEETRNIAPKKVTEVFKKSVDKTLLLGVGDDSIETTTNHPFYSPKNNGWVEAGSLDVGDYVLDSNGDIQQVTSSRLIRHEVPVDVYNFTVDDYHTYFVGDKEILVHNKCDDLLTKNEINYSRSKAGREAKKQALNDIANGKNYRKWGFNPKNAEDRKIIDFVQNSDPHRFPSYAKGDGLQCDFAHAVDVNKIVQAQAKGLITKEQAKQMISDPRNGMLTSRSNHFLKLHNKNWNNVTDVATVVKLRPSVADNVYSIMKAIGAVA